ncbi:MAG: AMP-binding protein [Lachnospiraceae bacterium]|nr:AMP-binding protein [Lachnospiraceae bacterium]
MSKEKGYISLTMFDLLKGFAIICVVLFHTIPFGNLPLPARMFTEAMMPAFFVMSGYWLKKKKISKGISYSYQYILKLYINITISVALLSCVIKLIQLEAPWFWIKHTTLPFVLGLSHSDGTKIAATSVVGKIITFFTSHLGGQTEDIYHLSWNGPAWFILALFFAWCIFFIVTRINNVFLETVIMILIALGGIYLCNTSNCYFCIPQGMIAAFYVYVGYTLKRKKAFDHNVNIFVYLLCIVLWAALTYFGHISLNNHHITNTTIEHILTKAGVSFAVPEVVNGFIQVCSTIFGSYVIIITFLMINKLELKTSAPLMFVGRYTNYILAVHAVELIVLPWAKVYGVLFNKIQNAMICAIIIFFTRSVIIAIACIIKTKLAKKQAAKKRKKKEPSKKTVTPVVKEENTTPEVKESDNETPSIENTDNLTVKDLIFSFFGNGNTAFSWVEDDAVKDISYDLFAVSITKTAKTLNNMYTKSFAVIKSNSYNYLCNVFALTVTGKNVTLIDSNLSSEDLAKIIKETKTEHIICDAEKMDDFKGLLVPVSSFDDITEADSSFSIVNVQETLDELCSYTGSITFYPDKTVYDTDSIISAAHLLKEDILGASGDYTCIALPLSDIFGFTSVCVAMLKRENIYLAKGSSVEDKDMAVIKPFSYVITEEFNKDLLTDNVKALLLCNSTSFDTEGRDIIVQNIIKNENTLTLNTVNSDKGALQVVLSEATDLPAAYVTVKNYVFSFLGNDNIAFSTYVGKEFINITYDEFGKNIIACAMALKDMPYTNFTFMGRNTHQYMTLVYALLLCGKNTILADGTLPKDNIATLLKTADTDFVICDEMYVEDYRDIAGGNIESITSLIEKAADLIDKDIVALLNSFDDEAGMFMIFTSGTSSCAKAVVHKANKLLSGSYLFANQIYGNKGERVYIPIPLHHIFGLKRTITALFKGETICYSSDPKLFKRDIKRFDPNSYAIVNSMLDFILTNNLLTPETKAFLIGGSPCNYEVANKINEMGYVIQNAYGLSELGGAIAINAIGSPLLSELVICPSIDVIIDEETSEISVKYQYIFEGYYKNEEANREAFDGDIFHTGDAGIVKEGNILNITGRIKDLLVLNNGEKLFGPEIDQELSSLNGIKEAGVTLKDNILYAVIVPEEGVTEEDVNKIMDEYNNTQTVIRKIKHYRVTNEPLPRTSIGKLQRRLLQ